MTQEKEDPFLKDGSLRELQVRAWYPKDYLAQGEKLPVVIASHGSCGSIDNNRSMYREFASHGYVVLAVGHMGLCDLSLASPILASLPDQQRATVSPSEQLQKLNADCLAFLQSSIGAS